MAVHEPDKLPKVDEVLQHRFDQGHLVGKLAQEVYPDGINIAEDDFKENLKKSKELLSKRKPLFEAAFKNSKIYSRADILVPVNDNEWDIVEVKSGTAPKEINIHDLAFQKHCYEEEGLSIKKCFLMHINGKYIRNGEINPNELFQKTDVDPLVNEASKSIQENINHMISIIESNKPPKEKICENCGGPNNCTNPEEFWSFLPENNVFCLYRGGKKGIELYEKGILSIKDIPTGFNLSANQQIQKKCEETGEPYIEVKKIKSFIDGLEFPLYFLDFETYSIAVPLHDGMSPYQQVPFQFSLHILNSMDSKPEHHSFLAEGSKDSRPTFLKALNKVIGKKGNIIVYNAPFENRILNELSRDFPKEARWVNDVQDRFVDLLIPFRKFYYYHPKQEGSASIKKVLPALTGKSYVDLEIAGGDSASLQYLYITHGKTDGTKPTEKEIVEIRKNLKKYCALDTMGMVDILKIFKK
tara:strand:+ start:3166 stop:4575 length:1410 start_codon:yes stop_codon:yes gene_type:complete